MPDTKSILLVEDEALIAMGQKRVLEKEGYQVTHVFSGEQAIELTCSKGQVFDLILMDLNLDTQMTGSQAARQILLKHDIPVVFLSSHTEKEIIEKTEEITSYGYVVKSSSPTALIVSIKMAFRLYDANQQLRQSETRYRRLVEGSPDVVYTFSSKCGGVYYSPRVEQLLGYSLEHLYAHPFLWQESIHPADLPKITESVRLFELGSPFDIEYRVCDVHGKWHWLRDRSIGRHVNGDEILIEGLATDITSQKQISDSLLASETALRTWLNAIQESAALIDRNGIVLMANSTIAQRMKSSVDEMIGTNIFSYVRPETAETQRQYMAKALETGNFVRFEDERFGRIIDNLIAPVIDADGQIRKLAILATDITERKQIEHSLQLTQLTVDYAADSIFWIDRDGHFAYVNKSACRQLGYSQAEMLTMRIFDINPSLLPGNWDDYWHALEEHNSLTIETIHKTKSGQEITVEVSNNLIKVGNKIFNCAFARDITFRKQTEAALRESEEQFRSLFENAPDAIFLAKPQTGIILDANQAACLLLGRPHKEIVGMSQSELHPTQNVVFSKESFQHHVQQAHEEGFTRPIENVVVRSDGTQVPVEIVAQIIRLNNQLTLMGTFRDITERKRVAKQLLESEQHFRELFESSPIGLWEEDFSLVKTRLDELRAQGVNDFRDYLVNQPQEINFLVSQVKIVAINQASITMMSAKSKDEMVLELPRYFSEKSIDVFKEEMIALAEGETHFSSEITVINVVGQEMILALNMNVIHGYESSLARVIVSFIDITERKHAENRAKSLVHEKELLLQEVHHRIKNNMNTISSMLQLQMDAQREVAAQVALQDASSRVQSMMVLYDKLYRSGNFDKILLEEYIPALLHQIVTLFPYGNRIRIETRIDPIELTAKVLSPLGIILNELATNAMKYAFTGRESGQIRLAATQKGHRVCIVFEDDGIGLPASFSIENSSGFGMQLVAMLLQQIDGVISINGEHGARFVIEFQPE